MKALFIITAFIALSFADLFDARDMMGKFDTFGEPKANLATNVYYLDESGRDSTRNCGTSPIDLPCQTYYAAKEQFYPKPKYPVEPNPKDYDGGEQNTTYIADLAAYPALVIKYNTDLVLYHNPVTINIGSTQNPTFNHPFEIDEHRRINFVRRTTTPQYTLTVQDKLSPGTPLFDVKSGSLSLTNLDIEHYGSNVKNLDEGIINFKSEVEEDFTDVTLVLTGIKIKQKDWKVTQYKPFVVFASETASISITGSTFDKATIATDGVKIVNAKGFTFNTNKFLNISGSNGNEVILYVADVKATGTSRTILFDSNEFVGIGQSGAVKSVLLTEFSGEQPQYTPNDYTLRLNGNKFVGSVAARSGGLELLSSTFDLIVSNTIFFNNTGTLASDILVTGTTLNMFEYQFDNTISTPAYPSRVSVKIGTRDLSNAVINNQTQFLIIEGFDTSINTDYTTYLTIGEALHSAKLGNLDDEILIEYSPGRHLKDGLYYESLTIGNSVPLPGAVVYYPQKVAVYGKQGEMKPMIVRTTTSLFGFIVKDKGEFRLSNLHIMSNGVEVTNSVLVDFSGEKLVIDDVEFVDNNHPLQNLINLASFSDVSITNSYFRNTIATRVISATLAKDNSKLLISGNTFSNDEFMASYALSSAAIYVDQAHTGDVKISGNTFKYLKVGASFAPIFAVGSSATIKIERNTFEDNTGGVSRAVILNGIGKGRIEDVILSNKIIKLKDVEAYKPVYYIDNEDYNYLIPEFANRRYVTKGTAPAGTVPEEVFDTVNAAISGTLDYVAAKLFVNIIGGVDAYETITINKPLINLEITGIEHIEDKLAKKDDEPQFKYEEVLGVQLNATGSFIVGTYRSLNIKDLNITYKGPKTEFVFIVNEGGVLTVKNAVIDVPVTEEETDEYVGYVKLEGKNVASFTNVKFGALKLKDPSGDFSTGAAIVGRNVIGLALIDTAFSDIVINNVSFAVSAIRVGLEAGSTETQHSTLSISNSVFEQSDVKKNNKENKELLDKELKTPAIYAWTELKADGTKGTAAVLSINNTKFTHLRGGAIRIRDIDAKIGASSRFSDNKPRFKNFKTLEWNIQVEGASTLDAEEESFVEEGTKDKNSYSWILGSGDNAKFKGTIAKNAGARLFTLPELKKASGKYESGISGAIVTIQGKRLYPLGDLKVEIFEEGKEEEAIALGVRQQYINEDYTHKESKLYFVFPIAVEDDKKKEWRVRLIYGLGKRTAEVKLNIK